jgi:hypothetical protein
MEKFLVTYDHPKLSQENINHLNRSITQNKIEAAIKSLPKKKSSGPEGFSTKFYQTYKKELKPTLLNCSMKYKGKEYYLTHFMKPILLSPQN